MLNPSRKLVELIRILDEGGFIFSGDPVQATEALRRVDGSTEEKIIRRAEMIDRNRMLRDTLERVRAGSFWLWVAAATFAFFTGFSGTYLLMDNQGLNFFLVLAGVLGMNTLMLAVWLAMLFLRVKVGRFFSSPATWFRGKDPVNQAVLRLYADEWRQRFGTLENRRNVAQPVALHAARNAGVGIVAAFGAAIYVQLGKHAVGRFVFGTAGGNVGMAACETGFSRA